MSNEEILAIVDEQDRVIGELARSDCHLPPYPIHREIFVLLSNSEGKIWLQRRAKTKQELPDRLTVTASGHVPKGESYEETAPRELEEEVGVRGVKLDKGRKWLHESSTNRAFIQLFAGVYDGEFVLDPDEVSEIRAYSREELERVREELTPAARECLIMLKYLEE